MSETKQHIGWLKQYLGGMTAENWKDMRDHALGQVNLLSDHLSRTPAPDAVREALELALGILGRMEPGDSRAVSNEFVAMAAVASGDTSDRVMAVIRSAKARMEAG